MAFHLGVGGQALGQAARYGHLPEVAFGHKYEGVAVQVRLLVVACEALGEGWVEAKQKETEQAQASPV